MAKKTYTDDPDNGEKGKRTKARNKNQGAWQPAGCVLLCTIVYAVLLLSNHTAPDAISLFLSNKYVVYEVLYILYELYVEATSYTTPVTPPPLHGRTTIEGSRLV